MKKTLILTVLLTGVLVLGFAQTALSGTYRYSANAYITFTGSYFTGSWNRTDTMSGTFSISGNRLTLNITDGTKARNTWTWTVVDANTLRDQDGDSWRKEGNSNSTDTVVWSYTDEVEDLINNYYLKDNPNFKLTYVYTPTDQFESRLPLMLKGKKQKRRLLPISDSRQAPSLAYNL